MIERLRVERSALILYLTLLSGHTARGRPFLELSEWEK